jgi:hypothetical protein
MSRKTQIIVAAIVVVGVAVVAGVAACPGKSADKFYGKKEWKELFKKADGWVALPLPDSRYAPGAIIQVQKKTGVRYIDHMRECNYPEEVLAPVIGTTPQIEFTKSRQFGGELVAAIEGVELGPQGGKISRVGLRIESLTVESLPLIRISDWELEGDNALKISDTCRRIFAQEDKYLVNEAARVNKATYTLYDASGAKIGLTGANLGEFLKIEASLSANTTSDGRLIIDQPVTVAVRRTVWAGDDFRILGSEEIKPKKTADPLIDELYSQTEETD